MYKLLCRGMGRELMMYQTIEEASVVDGEIIIVRPVVEAGGSGFITGFNGLSREQIINGQGGIDLIVHRYMKLEEEVEEKQSLINQLRIEIERRKSSNLSSILAQIVTAVGVNLLTANGDLLGATILLVGIISSLIVLHDSNKRVMPSFRKKIMR